MTRILVLTGFVCLIVSMTAVRAQKVRTLEECIQYAHDNNLQVKRQALQARAAENDYNYARAQVLPTANAFGNYMYNKGRAPNFDDYTYVDQAFQDANVGFESRLSLFSGLNNLNTIRSSRFKPLARSVMAI